MVLSPSPKLEKRANVAIKWDFAIIKGKMPTENEKSKRTYRILENTWNKYTKEVY